MHNFTLSVFECQETLNFHSLWTERAGRSNQEGTT